MEWTAATSRGSLADIHGFQGTVLAAFPSAVYVARSSSDSELLVIHDSSHGHTPTSLLVDRSSLSVVEPEAAVASLAGCLRVGDLTVDARHAAVWTPRPPSRTTQSAGQLEESRQLLLEHVSFGAFERLRDVDQLLTAIGHATDARVESALTRVIGSGQGLTPSGDDALVGMLGVLHRVCTRGDAAADLDQLTRIVPRLLQRTTPISAHYLRLALRGAFGEHLTGLLDAIAIGRVPGSAIQRVLAVGATSGADALVGVALTLEMLAHRSRFQRRKDVA